MVPETLVLPTHLKIAYVVARTHMDHSAFSNSGTLPAKFCHEIFGRSSVTLEDTKEIGN